MPGIYGIGDYGNNLYSASAVFDGEAVIDVEFDYFASGSRLFNSDAVIQAEVSLSAEAKALFGGIASIAAVTELLAEGKVVHVYRGEATIVLQVRAEALPNFEFAAVAEVDASPVIVIQEYYAGPFWAPEEIEGNWTPDVPPEGIWVPEPPFPKPWG